MLGPSTLIRSVAPTLTALLLCAPAAQAQYAAAGQRAGQWETQIGLAYQGSESASGENGSALDIDSSLGFAAGIAYHLNNSIALGFDMSWQRPDYTAVFNTEEEGLIRLDHELSMFTGQFNGTWNLFDGAFTPYLRAGLGWTYVDSNVADGPPVTSCWWDPWWGYICADFFSTYSDTRFSWTVGAGLRYDLNRNMFVRGGWDRLMLDGNRGADPSFDAFRMELGWKF